jgi:class 3 adenylate cyclase
VRIGFHAGPVIQRDNDAFGDTVNVAARLVEHERRQDKFVLKDHSSNGTFVTAEGDIEILLQREEFTLRKHGWIAFGQSRAGTSEVVEYFCE